jgi:hypothetical protein
MLISWSSGKRPPGAVCAEVLTCGNVRRQLCIVPPLYNEFVSAKFETLYIEGGGCALRSLRLPLICGGRRDRAAGDGAACLPYDRKSRPDKGVAFVAKRQPDGLTRPKPSSLFQRCYLGIDPGEVLFQFRLLRKLRDQSRHDHAGGSKRRARLRTSPCLTI